VSYDRKRFLAVGFVLRPHGVRGEIHVRHHQADSTTLLDVANIYLHNPDDVGEQVQYALKTARPVEGGTLCLLEGVPDRTLAERLKGLEVLVARSELPPLAEDEIYLSDLEGCEVVTKSGEPYGVVEAVEGYGAHEILVIRDGTRERMLPYVDAFVLSVDLEARRIMVDPPEGLPEEPLVRKPSGSVHR